MTAPTSTSGLRLRATRTTRSPIWQMANRTFTAAMSRRFGVVLDGRRGEGERPRVLVDPEHHHRGLVRGDRDPPLLQDPDEDRRRRPDLFDHLPAAADVGG